MSFDILPDLALQKIFSYCESKDIKSLRMMNRRFHQHTDAYRLYYNKQFVIHLEILKKDESTYAIEVMSLNEKIVSKTIPIGALKKEISSFDPHFLIAHDTDELFNMSPLWWKDRKNLSLIKVIDYRRYLPYFDKCSIIMIDTASGVPVPDLLRNHIDHNLEIFWLSGDGRHEFSDQDLLRIAELSGDLSKVVVTKTSATSKITLDGILNMIEKSKCNHRLEIFISNIENFENIKEVFKTREWIDQNRIIKKFDNHYKFRGTDASYYDIRSL